MRKLNYLVGLFLMGSLALAGSKGITKEGYVFTKTKIQLKEYINVLSVESYKTADDHLEKLRIKDEGGIFKAGTLVYIVSNHKELVEIRPNGSNKIFWTKKEAIK
ncbi:hypothetical protein [uncultured Cetobacterium sp.]|uniref:hypothetical protein n=1 Tax=uncultured Cetobacterium sp. TaxID=527638 RepID=UPI002623B3D5|nr:hypothetical protein [uncultured Cetobacterium sp.]